VKNRRVEGVDVVCLEYRWGRDTFSNSRLAVIELDDLQPDDLPSRGAARRATQRVVPRGTVAALHAPRTRHMLRSGCGPRPAAARRRVRGPLGSAATAPPAPAQPALRTAPAAPDARAPAPIMEYSFCRGRRTLQRARLRARLGAADASTAVQTEHKPLEARKRAPASCARSRAR